jgi:hypothetical protein
MAIASDVGYYPELTMTGILQKSSDTGVAARWRCRSSIA